MNEFDSMTQIKRRKMKGLTEIQTMLCSGTDELMIKNTLQSKSFSISEIMRASAF